MASLSSLEHQTAVFSEGHLMCQCFPIKVIYQSAQYLHKYNDFWKELMHYTGRYYINHILKFTTRSHVILPLLLLLLIVWGWCRSKAAWQGRGRMTIQDDVGIHNIGDLSICVGTECNTSSIHTYTYHDLLKQWLGQNMVALISCLSGANFHPSHGYGKT